MLVALTCAVACAPPDVGEDDSDAPVDDTPPPMASWLTAFVPDTRGCRVDLYDGETAATGTWTFLDAEGWPLAMLYTYGGASTTGALTPRAIDDPDRYVSLSRTDWNEDHSKAVRHFYVSEGGELTSDDGDGGVIRLDDGGRLTSWTLGDTVERTEYDSQGRMTRWSSGESTYWTTDGALALTFVRQFTCDATFPGTASLSVCLGTDTRCDYAEDSDTPDCTDGDFSRESLTTYDAEGYIDAIHTTDVGLADSPDADPAPVTESYASTYTWTHDHTVGMRRDGDNDWTQSVFASAERARAYHDTIAPTYREADGIELEVWSYGWSRTVLTGDDCDLEQAPPLPEVMLSALGR